MNMFRTPSGTARTVELHVLLADWGEGTSHAPGEEGEGAPATTDDATWRHRFFDTISDDARRGFFRHGQREPVRRRALETTSWSSAQMVADVQSWLDNAASNFGWLVLGDESATATAKQFDTRESTSPPVLTIEFTSGPTPTPTPNAECNTATAPESGA